MERHGLPDIFGGRMADVTFKQKLKGSFDLVFLFGRGIEPFERDNTRSAGLKSLWVPAVLFPFGLLSAWLSPPEDLRAVPKLQMLLTLTGETIVGTIVGIVVLWLAAVALDRRDRFWIAFQAGNWIGLPLSILSVPFPLLAAAGWYPAEKMDSIFTIITCYGFLVGACVVYRGLKIGWELAGFLACFGYVLGKAIQDLADTLNGVPHL
jgi:hypothetical protein